MKKALLFLIITAVYSMALYAQEKHILEGYDISIDGHTREAALINEMDLKAGTEFPDLASLEKAVARQEQDLVNLRVFDSISMTLVETGKTEDVTSYRITTDIKDSWTIYPIPYPKFDSNDGFRLGLKVFYDNAFGTLNNLYLGTNITFKYFEDGWENTSWTINPQLNDVKIGDMEYDFSLMQQKSYEEKKEKDGESYIEKYNYYNTTFDITTKFRFGDENKYYYSIKPGMGMNYLYEGEGYDGKEEPYFLSFSHGGGYSRVDWKGNFREGYRASIGNSIKYIRRIEFDEAVGEVKAKVDAESNWYKILHNRLNYSNRMYGVLSFNDDINGLGSNIRGVEDSTMYGVNGLFMSNDLNIAVIKWKGVGEAQFQPFFDIGVSKKDGLSLDLGSDLRYGTGADFILYLDKLKGLHARGTLAADLSDGRSFSDLRKYEIIITSSLSY